MLEGSVCFLPYIDVIRYAFCPVHHERAKRLKQGAKKARNQASQIYITQESIKRGLLI